jgi:REP element-mobilizing transposase RayT
MPRPPRIQFAGANHHIVTRGDARRKLFHETGHYERFTRGLEDEVLRSGWIVLAYCWMPTHIHALIQTPEPNLASGVPQWREWVFAEARREKVSRCSANGLKRAVVGVHDSDFQQIQGGQQMGIPDGTTLGRRNSWLTGVVAGFSFMLNRLNRLAGRRPNQQSG